MPSIEREIRRGEPIYTAEYQIIPQTQLFRIRFPGNRSGLTWNRPKSVIVKGADGQEYSLPVRDVTRLVIWSMLAGGILGAILIGMKRHP